MSNYENGPGNVPRLPDRVVDTLIDSAGVSRLAYDDKDQTTAVEQLVHDTCEELLARLPTPAEQPAPASTGLEVARLCREIRAAKTLAWRDSLFEQLLEQVDPAPSAVPVAARELDVEAERREPPTLPRYLLNMIGEYGMARTDSVGQLEVQHRWETLIGGIKRYASDFANTAQGPQPESAQVSTEQAGDAWGVGSCGCQACNPHMVGRMMFICATCGDKRCPHAANHVLNCQGRAPYPNNSPVGGKSD